MNLFWTLLSKLCFALLSLRYRIDVKGLEALQKAHFQKEGGILFLPNHPAHLDPLFLFLLLWPRYRMRPLVIEYIFRLPFLKPIMRCVKAVAIPNFDTSINALKIKRAEKAVQEVHAGLKAGQNYILYPSGRLKHTGRESLGGASAAHNLVENCPEANIVLIRTVGLWGSMFSRAILGKSPDLKMTIWQGIKVLLKNGIFFCPRRKIQIEISVEPSDFPRGGNRVEFNRYLENWYNRYPEEEEKPQLVSYAFWKRQLPQLFVPKKTSSTGPSETDPKVVEKIYREIRHILTREVELEPSMSLSFDVGMDSLNMAEVIAYMAKEFDVEGLHPEDMETVQDLFDIAEGKKQIENGEVEGGFYKWPEEEKRPSPALPLGRTIPEAFLNSVRRMGHFAACGDDVVGILSYRKMKRAVLVLATHFRKMEEAKVAVLLPASAAAYLVILALQCAGKTPVMLNWTLGPRYLDEMMKLSGAKNTVSSWRFLDRLSHVDLGQLTDQTELLEDIRGGLTLLEKLKGAFLSLCPTILILRFLKIHRTDVNDPCVILFTSGTESTPKGVPLSHKNILSNQRSAMQCVDFYATDVVYGILPPFHSFGFSVDGLFPLLGGIRIAFYPDPTDSFALAEGNERWKVTLFCSAPSFLRGLLHAAKAQQLQTIRLFVSGAEKASNDLYQQIEELGTGAKLVEGYGATECSPIISLRRVHLPAVGVGALLPDISCVTIHPETLQVLPHGTEGEICIHGPNVFRGYLGNPRSPFIEIEGKQWYRTGDLGWVDPEGNLILSGRLKRFTKVGGEMISLGAVEQALLEGLHTQAEGPIIALVADERDQTKPQLVVFTTIPLDTKVANQILETARFSRLVKISRVKQVEEIPLMGSGKIDYRKLTQTLESTST